MGTNSSQLREELTQILSQSNAHDFRRDQLLSGRMVVARGRPCRRREKQRQRRREQWPYHRMCPSSNSFEDEVLMDAYELEMMTPKERWEQEQLREWEGMIASAF